MKFIFLTFLLFNYAIFLSIGCWTIVKHYIDKRARPYQTTIFLHDYLTTSIAVFRKLKDTPRMLYTENSTIIDPDDPRYMDLIVILASDLGTNNLWFLNLMNLVSSFSERKKRQKVLLVHNDPDPNPDSILEMFELAWARKFLDFTIASANSTNCTFQSYNPFIKQVFEISGSKSAELFPDKLINVQGYPMKMTVGNYASVKKIRNSTGDVVDVVTFKFYLIRTVLDKLNFTYEYVENKNKTMPYLQASKIVHQSLDRNEVNFMVRPRGMGGDYKNQLIHVENDCDALRALVSHNSTIKASKIRFSPRIIIFSLGLPVFFVVMYNLVNTFKFKYKPWELFYIIQIFFGMSTYEPLGFINRLVYIHVILVSALYSMDFYSSFLEIGLIQDNLAFNTFKDLNDSGFSFLIESDDPKMAFWISDPHVQSIRNKTTATMDIAACLATITYKNDKLACIMTETIADAFASFRGFSFIKTKPLFNCLRLSYYFERASPYAEKFHAMFRLVYESGIERILDPKKTVQDQTVEKEEERNLQTVVLALVLVHGAGLSLLAFLIETRGLTRLRIKKRGE